MGMKKKLRRWSWFGQLYKKGFPHAREQDNLAQMTTLWKTNFAYETLGLFCADANLNYEPPN